MRWILDHWCFCRAKAWCRHSLTIAWARLLAVVSVLLAVITAPGVNEGVLTLLKPQYVPYYLLAVAVVTELARRRTL